MRLIIFILLLGFLPALPMTGTAGQPMPLTIASFSSAQLSDLTPPGWSPLTFPNIERHTAYYLVRDQDRIAVRAYSENAASGLYRKVDVNPADYPYLQWQWKVDHMLDKADLRQKDGDDYPARIYITFDYDVNRLPRFERVKVKLYTLLHGEPPPLAVINYIWDNRAPIDTVVPNAYTPRVQMVVVESGNGKTGRWLTERRNIVDDYHRAFGEPPGRITGIALMTDTDNTGEQAGSYYGDIHFLPRQP